MISDESFPDELILDFESDQKLILPSRAVSADVTRSEISITSSEMELKFITNKSKSTHDILKNNRTTTVNRRYEHVHSKVKKYITEMEEQHKTSVKNKSNNLKKHKSMPMDYMYLHNESDHSEYNRTISPILSMQQQQQIDDSKETLKMENEILRKDLESYQRNYEEMLRENATIKQLLESKRALIDYSDELINNDGIRRRRIERQQSMDDLDVPIDKPITTASEEYEENEKVDIELNLSNHIAKKKKQKKIRQKLRRLLLFSVKCVPNCLKHKSEHDISIDSYQNFRR